MTFKDFKKTGDVSFKAQCCSSDGKCSDVDFACPSKFEATFKIEDDKVSAQLGCVEKGSNQSGAASGAASGGGVVGVSAVLVVVSLAAAFL